MSVLETVISVLGQTLSLGERTARLTRDTKLLGNIPEFDSMAVVSVVVALEEAYGVVVEDDEVDASVFETIGTLTDFMEQKLNP